MRLVLAPMEGLADVYLRRLITAQGGFDWVVSEFIRVVDRPLPDKVFHGVCPELLNNSRTASGTPVRVQLLGNHLQAMAVNAERAVALGSMGVDINFGCPSKTVNRSRGGAILLREPDSLYAVVQAVRQAVPSGITVSAKMRLGYDDTSLMLENAAAIEAGGADELTVHARTRAQGYAPPAHWHELRRIREVIHIPLIANGDIWTVADYHSCTQLAGTADVMLGRGAIRQPDLARQIRENRQVVMAWAEVMPLVMVFWQEMCAGLHQRYWAGRLKQWFNHLRHVHPEAQQLWSVLRRLNSPQDIHNLLEQALDSADRGQAEDPAPPGCRRGRLH